MKKFAAKQTVGSKAGAHKFKTLEEPMPAMILRRVTPIRKALTMIRKCFSL